MYKLRNVRMLGNEHGQLRANTIYAELIDQDSRLVVSNTLDHVLGVIRDNSIDVEGVTVAREMQRGAMCSRVCLDLYKDHNQ